MQNGKDYLVRDYMRADVITVKAESTLQEAVASMLSEKTNALVVTDASGKVAGIVTSWGIIELIVPDYLEEDKHLASFEAGHTFEKRITMLKDKKVGEFMSTDVHTVGPDDSIMATATQISQFHIRQLPVVDASGILVGYINHTDIKRAIGDILGIDTSQA